MSTDKDTRSNESIKLNIDKLVHEPSRLLILSNLYVLKNADYLFLLHQTGLNQGNLSAHIGKLEEAGLISVTKTFVSKRPHTMLELTDKGRRAMDDYVKNMKNLFEKMS